MDKKTKAFLYGFINAFSPIKSINAKEIGDISTRINNKIKQNKEITIGKINQITNSRNFYRQ